MKKIYYEVTEIFEQDFILLEDIKNYLKVSSNEDDRLIKQLTDTAIESCENYSGLKILPRKIRYIINNFKGNQVHLGDFPIKEITDIKIISETKKIEISSELFEVDKGEGTILFKENQSSDQIIINYVTGFADNKLIPKSIMQGILIHIAGMYDAGTYQTISGDLKNLYQPYKRVRI